MNKGPLALRTISETADAIGVQQHVLRFWETKFTFIRPTKRAGGRRFYRPQDIDLLQGVKTLLYDRGYTIRGVQMLFKEGGAKALLDLKEGREVVATEQGLVSRAEIAAEDAAGVQQTAFDWSGEVSGNAQSAQLSSDMRESFLNIAKALEAAQATLGRQIGRTGKG